MITLDEPQEARVKTLITKWSNNFVILERTENLEKAMREADWRPKFLRELMD